jgi:hypothetical protein
MEREKLEREIHQLTQIIGADAFALVSKSTPIADRARLHKQIDIRTTMWAGLLKQLGGDCLGRVLGGGSEAANAVTVAPSNWNAHWLAQPG